MNIILTTLLEKRDKLIKQRDLLKAKMDSNPLGEAIQLRIEFQKIVKEFGIMSDEASKYAKNNADKEKELLKQSKWQIDNTMTAIDDLCKLDTDIYKLNNEIFILQARRDNK